VRGDNAGTIKDELQIAASLRSYSVRKQSQGWKNQHLPD
jgi:hypothetical protein